MKLMEHLSEGTEGVKLPGLQGIIYLLTAILLVRGVKSRAHIKACVGIQPS